MKKLWFLSISAMAIAVSALLIQFQIGNTSVETITFFPLNDAVKYKSASTSLTLLKDKKNNQHQVDWKIHSSLDQEAYLRQDMGLLFANGLLKGKLAKWEQDTADLSQEELNSYGESARYDAISFHYAELHGDGDRITSAQRMSDDMIYVVDSLFSPLQSFTIAKSNQEKEWKKVLDQSVRNRLDRSLKQAEKTFRFKASDYLSIPLDTIRKYEDQPITGFTKRETANILGKLWEGLYKNYYLGIKKSDGTAVDPIGSTMPLILIAKDKSHLLVVTQTRTGESIILKQLLQDRN
ncbi:hypothetical protein J7E38_00755 [Bacillus sp. ISL-35]|uniref:hypothetical protein n=1 Tax=Bacillus sp. ISL-35 TaxID=2819122 RepID=UPI001BE8500A|nr:hypothetical protein [Bacillus sp. ISL-35]MBT2677506.1 hypothetical protein [Bacillus sp. ISL-35]MBT2702106.1 hypothetical protein [Chryseobacterium sp. ISL-80]